MAEALKFSEDSHLNIFPVVCTSSKDEVAEPVNFSFYTETLGDPSALALRITPAPLHIGDSNLNCRRLAHRALMR